MKLSKILNEWSVSAVLIGFAILLLDPFMLWMPDPFVYMMTAGLVALFALFVGFVWRERVVDERDELHRMSAARTGYLAGMGVLVLGMVIQTFTSRVDPWLVVALTAIIIGKLAGRIYNAKHR